MPRVLPVLDARWVYGDAAQAVAVAESGGRGATALLLELVEKVKLQMLHLKAH